MALARKVKEAEGFEISDSFFKWMRSKVASSIALTGDEWMAHQEYPMSPQDAFQNSGICVFNKRKLAKIQNIDCCPPIF